MSGSDWDTIRVALRLGSHVHLHREATLKRSQGYVEKGDDKVIAWRARIEPWSIELHQGLAVVISQNIDLL